MFDFPSDIHKFLQRYQTSALATHFPTKAIKKNLEKNQDFDLVIPVFHGVYGEDGQITAFLSTLGYTYAYSPFTTHALCLDKYKTNLFVKKMGIRIPMTHFIQEWDELPLLSEIDFPFIIKPNHGGSSLSTSKVKNETELRNAYQWITDDDVLIQEYIPGREFTVGVYRDMTWYHSLPIIEIQTIQKWAFFDYTEKYETDGSNEVFMEWEENLQKNLIEQSIKIAKILHCAWVVRIDYRYDGADIYFLEVNTIPGFTSGSLVPKMWKKAGKTEKEFVEMLFV
jgi:D-alanine-D-alanine ligase